MAVGPEKIKQLEERMERLSLFDEDLSEKFIQASGKGGQKVNKTASAVYLVHHPSGVEVKCQRTRSQSLNRYYARVELCEKTEEQVLGEKSKKRKAQEKVRRQKRRRSRRSKARMLADKSHQGEKKKLRGPVKDLDG
jgi:protein subunit release factor B